MSTRFRSRSMARRGAATTLALACVFVGGLGDTSAAQTATSWSPAIIINPYVGGLPLRWTGGTRLNHFQGELIGLESISCALPTFCVAVGGARESSGEGAKREEYERGYVLTFNGHAWSRPLRVDGQLQLISVSCPSSSFCAAVGNHTTGPSTFAGYTLTYNGHSWSKPALRVKGPIERQGRPSELEMISCASRSFCVVTNRAGEVLRYNGHSWSEPVASYPKGGLRALACPVISVCVALVNVPGPEYSRETSGEGATVINELPFQEAFALTFNGSGWSVPSVLPVAERVASLSCPTASFCLATGAGALGFNGRSWSTPEIVQGRWLESVSCASPSFCVAVQDEQSVLTFNGGSWSAPTYIEATFLGVPGLGALSCPSASLCIVLDDGKARYYPASAAPRPFERPATLRVSPTTVHPGQRVRVFGSVGRFNGQLDCRSGEQVELESRAFTSTLLGQIVYGKLARNGTFSTRATIPAYTTAGLYSVSGRCLTGELGVTAQLRVLAR